MVSVKDTEVTLIELVQPFDVNPIGRLFGGRILEWIANVGTVAAVRFSKGPAVLAYLDRHFFINPGFIGDVVRLRARIQYVGRSSMEVFIEASKNGGKTIITATTASYVAVDEYGQPRRILNKLEPRDEDERREYEEAKSRYEVRKGKIANRREERYNVSDPTVGLRWRIESSRWVTPQDAFTYNMVSAGRLLAWIDEVAGSLASEYAGTFTVTGSIDETAFYSPIHVGEIVRIAAGITYVGKSSIETMIHVTTEDAYGNVKKVCTAYYTYVAIDEKGRPIPVPKYEPSTDYEKAMFNEGLRRKNIRDLELAKIKAQLGLLKGSQGR